MSLKDISFWVLFVNFIILTILHWYHVKRTEIQMKINDNLLDRAFNMLDCEKIKKEIKRVQNERKKAENEV